MTSEVDIPEQFASLFFGRTLIFEHGNAPPHKCSVRISRCLAHSMLSDLTLRPLVKAAALWDLKHDYVNEKRLGHIRDERIQSDFDSIRLLHG